MTIGLRRHYGDCIIHIYGSCHDCIYGFYNIQQTIYQGLFCCYVFCGSEYNDVCKYNISDTYGQSESSVDSE